MANHRAGKLKQTNKKHKLPGGTRPSNEHAVAGRTAKVRGNPKKNSLAGSKQERLNRQKQLNREKRLNTIRDKRKTTSYITRLVAVVPLVSGISVEKFQQCLLAVNHKDWSLVTTTASTTKNNTTSYRITFKSNQQKCYFQFFFDDDMLENELSANSTHESLLHTLSSYSIADTILLLTEYDVELVTPLLSSIGEQKISLLSTYGYGNICLGLLNHSTKSNNSNNKLTFKHIPKVWKSEVDHLFFQLSRLQCQQFPSSSAAEAVSTGGAVYELTDHSLSKGLSQVMRQKMRWRNTRSYLVSNNSNNSNDDQQQTAAVVITPQQPQPTAAGAVAAGGAEGGAGEGEEQKYTIQVTGCLRGVPMYVHSLVHIQGVGVGRVVRIAREGTAVGAGGARGVEGEGGEGEGEEVIEVEVEKQDDLSYEATPDGLLGEQTWPEDSEMMNRENDQQEEGEEGEEERMKVGKRSVGKLSKAALAAAGGGTGDDDEEDDDMEDDEGDEEDEEEGEDENDDYYAGQKILEVPSKKNKLSNNRHNKKTKTIKFADEDGEGEEGDDDNDMDLEDDEEDQPEHRQKKKTNKEELEDFNSDHVDTPITLTARDRFARYRSLQSFRSSFWHPKENLPAQYSRIYALEDMKGMQRRMIHLIDKHCKAQVVSLAADGSSIGGGSKKNKKNNGSHSNNVSNRSSRANSMVVDDQEEGEEEDGMVEEDDRQSVTSSHTTATHATSRHTGVSSSFILPNNEDYLSSDQMVTITIADVSSKVLAQLATYGYLIFFALHQHELKYSVSHFNIQRYQDQQQKQQDQQLPLSEEEEIEEMKKMKSKDVFLFHNGFRAYWTKPIFSEGNLNCDKHKFLRYLPMDGYHVASCIGPVMMTPCPLLIFKYNLDSQRLELVATGNFLGIEPDRIILKKIILTGNPIRVRKRTAVIKHMFFDPMDVKWFKPAELVTILGLRGHIKESVGTHGLYKAIFSGPITQNDQVQLVLYKRVYPKIPDIEELPPLICQEEEEKMKGGKVVVVSTTKRNFNVTYY